MANFEFSKGEQLLNVVPSWYLRKHQDVDIDSLRDVKDKTGEYRVRKFVRELSQGSIKGIADANIIDFEVKQLYGKKYLSGKERTFLMSEIHERGNDALNEWSLYLHTYDKIREYSNKMLARYAIYERDLIELSSKVILWITYEETAKTLTRALRYVEEDSAQHIIMQSTKARGVTLRQQGDMIVADVSGKGQLYEKIQELSRDVEEGLSKVRAYEVVLYAFLQENSLEWMLPLNVEDIFSSLYDGRLGIEEDIPSEYFRSVFRLRALEGETTEEEERRAVIPDYTEIEADSDTVEIACNVLTKIMEG